MTITTENVATLKRFTRQVIQCWLSNYNDKLADKLGGVIEAHKLLLADQGIPLWLREPDDTAPGGKYTPEQVEKLAEFARHMNAVGDSADCNRLRLYGLINPDGTLADWLRPEDWADRAAAEFWNDSSERGPAVRRELAAIIRRHAEDRT